MVFTVAKFILPEPQHLQRRHHDR